MSETHPTVYLVRHGQTEWSLSGQHTGRTDIPLTEKGREQADCLRPLIKDLSFARVLSSPRMRAQETARLIGLGSRLEVREELAEVDYGDYEGLTTGEIRKSVPDWTVWSHACPNGETIQQADARVRRVLQEISDVTGNVIIFAHGHILRILACAYIDVAPENGKHLQLDTCTVSILSREHESPTIKVWNSPVITAL